MTLGITSICGHCGERCAFVRSVSWSNKMACEKCFLGRWYKFVMWVKNSHPPYWVRRVIAFLLPFSGVDCNHCHLNFRFGKHSVEYGGKGSYGIGLLCHICFFELPTEQVVKYHRDRHLEDREEIGAILESGEKYGQFTGWTDADWDEEWELIENKVREDKEDAPRPN